MISKSMILFLLVSALLFEVGVSIAQPTQGQGRMSVLNSPAVGMAGADCPISGHKA